MKIEKEKLELIRVQSKIAEESIVFPFIIEMKNRIDTGEDLVESIIKEWLQIRKEWLRDKLEIKALTDNKKLSDLYSHPTMNKFNWLFCTYIAGNIEMLKRILDNDLDTKPKGNNILENSLISHEVILSFLFEKEGLEKWKAKIKDNEYYHPENVSTKSELRVLNKYIGKKAEKVFKTNLTDKQRVALCDEIISNNGSRIGVNGQDNRLFVDISEKHRQTLMYLFGGDRPEKIVPINYAVNSNIYSLLKSITDVDGTGKNKGGKVVPNFMATKICTEILRDKDGKKFDKIKQ
jgi:hypothetical protein